jgi:cell wall-associated NlpC family hydrolase
MLFTKKTWISFFSILYIMVFTPSCQVMRAMGIAKETPTSESAYLDSSSPIVEKEKEKEKRKPSAEKPVKTSNRPGVSISGFTETELRQSAVALGLQQRGTRYRYAGRAPGGFDCSGFTHYVLKNYNVNVSPASRIQCNEGIAVDLTSAKAGDLVFFSRNGRRVSHVAMVTRNEEGQIYIVHSTSSRGVIEENLSTSKYWKPKILFARDVITPLNIGAQSQ